MKASARRINTLPAKMFPKRRKEKVNKRAISLMSSITPTIKPITELKFTNFLKYLTTPSTVIPANSIVIKAMIASASGILKSVFTE